MQCPFIKSFSLWYGTGFFLIYIYCYAFIVQNEKNTHFLNEISSKNFKSLNGPKFNSMYINIMDQKKFTQEFHSQR
jgi:hypothetical protein